MVFSFFFCSRLHSLNTVLILSLCHLLCRFERLQGSDINFADSFVSRSEKLISVVKAAA